MNAARQKYLVRRLNKYFLLLDTVVFVVCGILFFTTITHGCLKFLWLYYWFLYACQCLQHYLIYKMPTMDINNHARRWKILVGWLCLMDVGYMFVGITFWQRTEVHPLYCGLCNEMGLGVWIGLLIDMHSLVVVIWGIYLIHGFVSRRYYLLAMGGYDAEQRIMEQRERQRENLVLEPNYHDFPLPPKHKYYKFEDTDEPEQQCSICLNKQSTSKYVNAGCGHYFHQGCLQNWAKVNSTCPQCRHELPQAQPNSVPQQA